MMNYLAKFSRRKLYHKLIVRLQSTSSSFSDIHIPNRIERNSTDILKALESTVSRDYMAPHYKFHDDPYLTPLSTNLNRTYALAKESGRKAAMWIREEHRDLFQHKLAEPEIKAFVPPSIYTEKTKVTEDTLLYEISNGHVSNSITIYNLLKEKVTIPTKQALLELLCFHNNNEYTSDELLEARWYQSGQKKRAKNSWVNLPQIETLFEFLKKQEPAVAAAAYSTMLCGLAKYFNPDRAWHLYMESKGNNIPLCVDAYNAMISIVSMLRERDDKKTLITEIYRTMAANGISPNIHTFNAALHMAVTFETNQSLDFACNTLANIAKFKLKPSLATYVYLLRILSRFGDAAYKSFMKILKSLKNETLVIQHASDLSFFVIAMEMASRQFCDRQAGEMVNELLLAGENYKFIGGNYKENVYYRAYLELILATEEFETFFKLYSKLVPHVTIPEPSVMKSILEALQLHPAQTATQYIPKLWSHMFMFGHLDREGLLENILHLMSVHCKPASDSPLNAQFAGIALAIWDHIQTQNAKRIQHVTASSTVIGDIIILLLRGDTFDKTVDIMSTLIESPHLIIGVITVERINEIFELCLAQAHVPAILTLLEYITSCGMDELEGTKQQIATRLYNTVPLTSNQENILISLVGDETFRSQLSDEN